jgi:hypothetical protein
MASGHTGNDAATRENVEKNDSFSTRASAMSSTDQDLAWIVAAWDALPDHLKRAMLAMLG